MIPLPQPRFKPFHQTLGRWGEYTRTVASARGLAAKTSTLESPADNRLRTVVFQAGLKAGFCPAMASSGPVCPGIALLLAYCLAARPLPPVSAKLCNFEPAPTARTATLTQNATNSAARNGWHPSVLLGFLTTFASSSRLPPHRISPRGLEAR